MPPLPPVPRSNDETEDFVTRIYLAVIAQPRPTRALLVAQGIPGEMVDRCLSILHARGMIDLHQDGSWEVFPPDIALPAMARALESTARDLRASSGEMARIFFHARAQDRPPPQDVQVLESLEELHDATADLVSAARETVISMRDRSPRTEVLFGSPMSAHRERSLAADGSHLSLRGIYDVSVLDIDNAGEVVAARAAAGERIRFLAGLPFSAVVVDTAGAVVDVSRYEPSGRESLLVRSRPLVLGLLALMEGIWRLGSPLDRVAQDGLDRRDATILAMLSIGHSDATIARQTKISQRTVERRVRSLMSQLGAQTRFQAGVQAARRGWI